MSGPNRSEGAHMTKSADTKAKELSAIDVFNVDLDDFTLGEIETFEDVAQVPFNEVGGLLGKEGQPIGKLLLALGLVVLQREDPEATLDDARKIKINIVTEDEADPLD